MSDMSLGLPFWLRSYMCCRLTASQMSLPIYQLIKLTVHQLRRSLLFIARKSEK
ncbi:hypothetical protein F383_03279 [Gossypium arboreum]|uniref:Uncharacterized protein n=1 Tax=Gossypium arboreum TaxID=29729 RepID=A0A0B0P7S7_GOSAR|nr:hypothetical protein F383_03279 [Gossypium arboreum]